MLKEEKLNRKKALKRVLGNADALRKTSQTIKDIFDISFSRENFTMFEVMNRGGFKSLSYGFVKDKIFKFSNYFSQNIKDSKYVGVHLDNTPFWVYAFYGLLDSGFIPVLLSTKNPLNEINDACIDLGVKYIVSEKESGLNAQIINPKEINLDAFSGTPVNNWENEIVFLTSGTSGKSKMVVYSGEELCEQIYNSADVVKLNKMITVPYKGYIKHLVIVPFYHVFGFIAVLLWDSFFNITFVLPVNLSEKAIQQACALTHPAHIYAVPLFWEKICSGIDSFAEKEGLTKKLDKALSFSYKIQKIFPRFGYFLIKNIIFKSQLDKILGKSITFCISGGSFIKNDTLRKINCIGYPLFNGYGSTEAGITSFSFARNIEERVTGTIGQPFPAIKYELVKAGDYEELYVKAKSVAKYFIKDGEKIPTNHCFKTNDAAYMKGNNYYLNGRVDEIVVTENGENYSIPTIESNLHFAKASDFIVFFDKEAGHFTLLVSYEKNVINSLIYRDLKAVENLLPSLKIGEVFYTFYSFPKANDIKIRRNIVIDYFKNNKDKFKTIKDVDQNGTYEEEAIASDVLDCVIELFKKHLKVENITHDSNFYTELGGDSLTYMSLLGSINEKFGIEITIGNYAPQTPKDFALLISRSIK